jgi:predicted nucleotidyltransferase component of viral defense system
MQNDLLTEQINATYSLTGISPRIIEKDYYITRLLNKIARVNDNYFKLAFAGGTSLAKAYRLTQRMSEDIDFKLINLVENLSAKKQRTVFSDFRKKIITELENTEFICRPQPTEGRNTHVKIHVDYPAIYPKDKSIRDFILLELTISQNKLPMQEFFISSIIDESLNPNKIFHDCKIECLNSEETTAEKWVALTRRVAYAMRFPEKKEDEKNALIRHVYDLYVISQQNKLGDNFFYLAESIMHEDKEKYKSLHPEYYSHPVDEINYSIQSLHHKDFKDYYENFLESMVYGENAPSYTDALSLIKNISIQVTNLLQH